MLRLDYDLTQLRGAEYNPRQIAPEDMDVLRDSVRTLGVVKPIIARRGLIVAGHQRTRALLSIGVERGPVFELGRDTTTYDEVRFNQLHNGTDIDTGDEEARITPGFAETGYQTVDARSRVTGNMRSGGAIIRQEMCEMILRFGPWGGVVSTMSGEVIHAAQYALAAHLTGTPLTVFVVRDDDREVCRSFLDRSYGTFSYDRIRRETYIQTLAQMMRLRDGPSGKANRSSLYEGHVLPRLTRDARLLDFGSGQGDYFRLLRDQGFKVFEVEFFRRAFGRKAIDVAAVHRMIDRMVRDISTNGRFDMVVCDSVLNSVDSREAEGAVMRTVSALCQQGGLVFFSGRPREKFDRALRRTKQTASKGARRETYFHDADGLSAIYRDGSWFFQKFHTREQVRGLAAMAGLEILEHVHGENSWQVAARKVGDLPDALTDAAIRFEFELPLAPGRPLGRSADVLSALRRQGQGTASR